jgi:hypothetical protein
MWEGGERETEKKREISRTLCRERESKGDGGDGDGDGDGDGRGEGTQDINPRRSFKARRELALIALALRTRYLVLSVGRVGLPICLSVLRSLGVRTAVSAFWRGANGMQSKTGQRGRLFPKYCFPLPLGDERRATSDEQRSDPAASRPFGLLGGRESLTHAGRGGGSRRWRTRRCERDLSLSTRTLNGVRSDGELLFERWLGRARTGRTPVLLCVLYVMRFVPYGESTYR